MPAAAAAAPNSQSWLALVTPTLQVPDQRISKKGKIRDGLNCLQNKQTKCDFMMITRKTEMFPDKHTFVPFLN